LTPQAKLNSMMNANVTEANINEFGRFDNLKNCIDLSGGFDL